MKIKLLFLIRILINFVGDLDIFIYWRETGFPDLGEVKMVRGSYMFGYRFYSTREQFLNSFYMKLSEDQNLHSISKSNVSQYQDVVFNMLHEHKKDELTEEDLISLQKSIEELTIQFDDIQNRYQVVPDLIKLLISPDKVCAKDYLKSCSLSSDDLSYLNYFDHYTLEAIMIYVLGSLFNCLHESPAVRVSTLVEHLDTYVQAMVYKDRHIALSPSMSNKPLIVNTDNKEQAPDNTEQATDKKTPAKCAIGSLLVEFLVDREVITLSNDLSFTDIYVAKKKKKKYYIPKSIYAICNFDISILPIKLNLPMVCKPVDWASIKNPTSLTDLSGGYLSMPIGDFYQHRYRLITSRDLDGTEEKTCVR